MTAAAPGSVHLNEDFEGIPLNIPVNEGDVALLYACLTRMNRSVDCFLACA